MPNRTDPHTGAPTDDLHKAVLSDLRRLERAMAACEWPARNGFAEARVAARERAVAMLQGGGSAIEHRRAALVAAAQEFLLALIVGAGVPDSQATDAAQRVEELTGVPRLVLAAAMLRSPELLLGAPGESFERVLAMLVALAPLRSASLWSLDVADRMVCIARTGEGPPSRRARALALRILGGEDRDPGSTSERRQLIALPVGDAQQPEAALVGSCRPWMGDLCQSFFEQAAPILGALLERARMLAANESSERALVEASERKLTRLGFDLHDGPIQDVALIAEDLRLFDHQLKRLHAAPSDQALLRGRVEDLEAQLGSLNSDLRRISGEVQAASVLLNKPFEAALHDRIRAFTARTGIEPTTTVEGDMGLVSTSQQIALLNVIQEALANVREHAQANAVEVKVSAGGRGVEAQVRDNGRGFELERALVGAAQRGRIGLIAMHERIRLLGGQCTIESRPGGPTVISVALNRWLPAVGPAQRREPLHSPGRPRRPAGAKSGNAGSAGPR
jgi:signal transduction histidine kinase